MANRRKPPSAKSTVTPFPTAFARALRRLRLHLGWTQAEMAERIGLSDEAYARIERGRAVPRADTLVRLAHETGASLDELLLDRGAVPPTDELRAAVIAVLRGATDAELEILRHLAWGLARLRSQRR